MVFFPKSSNATLFQAAHAKIVPLVADVTGLSSGMPEVDQWVRTGKITIWGETRGACAGRFENVERDILIFILTLRSCYVGYTVLTGYLESTMASKEYIR